MHELLIKMKTMNFYLVQTSIFHVHSMGSLEFGPACDSFHRYELLVPLNAFPNCSRLGLLCKINEKKNKKTIETMREPYIGQKRIVSTMHTYLK